MCTRPEMRLRKLTNEYGILYGAYWWEPFIILSRLLYIIVVVIVKWFFVARLPVNLKLFMSVYSDTVHTKNAFGCSFTPSCFRFSVSEYVLFTIKCALLSGSHNRHTIASSYRLFFMRFFFLSLSTIYYLFGFV